MNPERYLHAKLESRDRKSKVPETLKKPLAAVDYALENRAELHTDDETVHGYVEWERATPTEGTLLDELVNKNAPRVISTGDPSAWYTLLKLGLKEKSKDRNIEIDFRQEGIEAVFNPTVDNRAGFCFVLPEDKFIVALGDIAQPITLISVLHEIGHIKDLERLDDETREEALNTIREYRDTLEKDAEDIPDTVMAEIMNRERNAWAFTLKAVQPLLRAGVFSKDDALIYMHQHALQSYSNYFHLIHETRESSRILAELNEQFAKLIEEFEREATKELEQIKRLEENGQEQE